MQQKPRRQENFFLPQIASKLAMTATNGSTLCEVAKKVLCRGIVVQCRHEQRELAKQIAPKKNPETLLLRDSTYLKRFLTNR